MNVGFSGKDDQYNPSHFISGGWYNSELEKFPGYGNANLPTGLACSNSHAPWRRLTTSVVMEAASETGATSPRSFGPTAKRLAAASLIAQMTQRTRYMRAACTGRPVCRHARSDKWKTGLTGFRQHHWQLRQGQALYGYAHALPQRSRPRVKRPPRVAQVFHPVVLVATRSVTRGRQAGLGAPLVAVQTSIFQVFFSSRHP